MEESAGRAPRPNREPPLRRLVPSALTVGLLAVTSIAFTVAPSPETHRTADGSAAEVAFLAEDQAGDANGINGQGLPGVGDTVPATPTDPVQVPEADLLSARLTSTWHTRRGADGLLDRIFTGVEFRTGLAAQPGPDSVPVLHRFVGTIDGCETGVEFAAGASGGAEHGHATVVLRGAGCDLPSDPATGPGTVEFSGDGIAWHWDPDTGEAVVTVDATRVDEQLADRLTDGALYELAELNVRHHSPTGLTVPVVDEMDGQGATAHLGADVPADQQQPPVDGGHTGGPGNDVPRDTSPLCGRYDGGTTGTSATVGDDRTGAGADTLSFGLHAPATGAAPLPTTAFHKASDLYWRAVTEDCGESVLGRSSVTVEFHDDKYDPNSAGQVCKELASRSFLVLGGGGTDQVQRCGQLAAVQSFPYFSVGVTEAGLRDNPWYFGSTMSYREQGGLLAEYVAANPDQLGPLSPDARIGTIVTDTPNFDDALHGWNEGLAANGLQNQVTIRPTKGDTSWYAATAEEFQRQGVEVVYFLNSPLELIEFADTADQRYGYNPLYIGVGSDTSLDAVLQSGCREPGRRLDGGVWLSGTPGLDAAPTAFFEAAEIFDAPADDIALRMWAFAEQQRELLEGYEEVFGHDLTREDFRAFVERSGTTTDGTFPTASWSESDHFPSGGMHVLQANCELEEHVTLHADASGF